MSIRFPFALVTSFEDVQANFEALEQSSIPQQVGNTTGLSSAQIDNLFARPPVDGTVLVDATNNLYLQRAGGKWYKSAALTLIP